MGVGEPNDVEASLPPGESVIDLTKAESDSELQPKKSAFPQATDEFLGQI
jgi:hypothetical protein